MCGRFSLHLTDLGEVGARFGVAQLAVDDWHARYNIAPSQPAPVVLEDGVRTLALLEWGLIAPWTRTGSPGRRPINARVETAATLPSFRDALRQRRCAVPATGYYEWREGADGRKQPVWIAPADAGVLALAGLWQAWQSPEGELRRTFALLTMDAAGPPAEVHDRMPLLLPFDQLDAWLSPAHPGAPLLPGLRAEAARLASSLVLRPVSRLVNAPANDGPECLQPVAEPSTDAATKRQSQLGLFGES
jgi:putative SOS response-associated peptidase YedK